MASEIVELGRATRFGAGRNCPLAAQHKAAPPWSIRRLVRRMAALELNCTALGSVTPAILRHALIGPRARPTIAQALAIELWVMALSGNLAAVNRVVRMVDGPLK